MLAVEKGFHGFQEVNRVVYDPRQVTVPRMEEWLRGAGTYVQTVEPKPPPAVDGADRAEHP